MRTPRTLAVLLMSGTGAVGLGQYWAPLQPVAKLHPQVNVVYGDSVWDKLLVGGNFKWAVVGADTIFTASAAMWDGVGWSALPAPVDVCIGGNICSPVWEFMRIDGRLHANGGFAFWDADSLVNEAFARWNEQTSAWERLPCVNPGVGGMATLVPHFPQDTLYLTGYRGTLCGYDSSCVFAYVGDTIVPLPYQAPVLHHGPTSYVGFVFKYQGVPYLTGLLYDPLQGQHYSFMRWNGTAWEGVPGWSTLDPIKDVLIKDGWLYVCGWFFEAGGAPGNMVARFNGTQWEALGSGLLAALPSSSQGVAMDLHEWNGDLYVAGQFNYAGGVPAENAARWDGSRRCGLGGSYAMQTPGGKANEFTVWRDELYMSGGFITIDGDTMWHVARWLGQVENCSAPVTLPEGMADEAPWWVPLEPGRWQLRLPQGQVGRLELWDARGRLVLVQGSARDGHVVDLADRAPGVYLARLIEVNGAVRSVKALR